MSDSLEIFIAGSADDVAREAAARFVAAATEAIAARGRFSVALSGGSTPRRLYMLLAQPPYAQSLAWSMVHLFFADERYVPHDHPDSTVQLVRETLLTGALPARPVLHPMPVEASHPETDASRYAADLADHFGEEAPRFDLILLGMGPDGHTASLFPGHPDYPGTVAAVHDSPKPPPTRLTLTLSTLNQARQVLFLVTGADKASMVRDILYPPAGGDTTLPAGQVRPSHGRLAWLLDPPAAASLPDSIPS